MNNEKRVAFFDYVALKNATANHHKTGKTTKLFLLLYVKPNCRVICAQLFAGNQITKTEVVNFLSQAFDNNIPDSFSADYAVTSMLKDFAAEWEIKLFNLNNNLACLGWAEKVTQKCLKRTEVILIENHHSTLSEINNFLSYKLSV